MGLKSHIPYLLGEWSLSPINLRKCVSQARKQREKICMGSYNSLRQPCFDMKSKWRRGRRDLEIEKPWRVNFGACWIISREYLE
jgi:hypothetical protein